MIRSDIIKIVKELRVKRTKEKFKMFDYNNYTETVDEFKNVLANGKIDYVDIEMTNKTKKQVLPRQQMTIEETLELLKEYKDAYARINFNDTLTLLDTNEKGEHVKIELYPINKKQNEKMNELLAKSNRPIAIPKHHLIK